jgi:hypothetical protein
MSLAKFLLAIKKFQNLMIKKISQMVLEVDINTNGSKREQWHKTPCHKLNISSMIH